MNRNKSLVVLIDDDYISNILTAETIKESYPEDQIISFTDAVEGLTFVVNKLISNQSIILFLDVNMPGMSGWDVIDSLLSLESKDLFHLIRIYMLSSSIDYGDKTKAHNYNCVSGYLEKPLNEEDFKDIIFKTNYN
jgi:CheY-like chemotaxis protein